MRCPSCGQDNASGARFCLRCGSILGLSEGEGLKRGQLANNGQYRILRRLGKGGMGSIYLAQNTQAFDRLCVIKELNPYYEVDEEQEAQARFEQEARTLAALKHPNIPDMYGYFSEGNRYYIVIEYIEGDNLETGLTHEDTPGDNTPGKPLELEAALRYATEMCRVLEYLAQVKPQPVVHCDIKPSNIIVDRNSQQAVLVDFGASVGMHKGGDAAGSVTAALASEALYGTVGYAAPEMYQGQATPKSDVFSLAATLYHLLTDDDPREHPFQWPHMERIPEALQPLLQRALATDSATRPSAEKLRRELEAFRANQNPSVTPLGFPEGNQATTVTGILDLSVRYWEYARKLLYDGSLETWLRGTLRDTVTADLVHRAAQEYPEAPDAGLDDLLRTLNPRLPPPKLTVTAQELDLGTQSLGEERAVEVRVANPGPGGAHGAILSDAVWLQVRPEHYALAPGATVNLRLLPVRLATLPADQPHRARVLISTDGGPTSELRVQLQVAALRTAPRPSTQPAARPTTTAKPSPPRPASVTPSRPPQPTVRRATAPRRVLWPWLLALALIVLGGGGGYLCYDLTYRQPLATPEVTLQRGLQALQEGRATEWSQVAQTLARLDPNNRSQVRAVALALDDAMVQLPAGTLRMGYEEGSPDQRPVHDVAMREFLMDRFEVTNVQYQRCVDEGGCVAPAKGWSGGRYPAGQALRPVVGISWDEARAYATWANKRLPSEAEWEWAARGAEGRLYPWGNDERRLTTTGHPEEGRTAAVGSLAQDATPNGIMDLAGNAREWTADRYGQYRDPHNPPAEGRRIAVRGQSWRTYLDVAAARQSALADERDDDLGLRCVR